MAPETPPHQPGSAPSALEWQRRFLEDLAVVRSANTVRAYAADLRRWIHFCDELGIHPFVVRPRTAIAFVRAERDRSVTAGPAGRARTLLRRPSAVRQGDAYPAGGPDPTRGWRQPPPRAAAPP